MTRFAVLAGLLLFAIAGAGCQAAPEASRSLSFDATSDKAVVVFGTSADRNQTAPEDPWYREPRSLLTHWQQYDPESKLLVPEGSRVKSLRSDGFLENTDRQVATVHVLEVDPGDYALIATMLGRTLTLFVEPTGNIRYHYDGVSDRALAGITTRGPVAPGRHFVFSVRPGQVVYIGHFDFVHAGNGNHKIVDINHSQEADAARAALRDYPGIEGDLVTLDLSRPTEQAAR
jgi:hypothetical protein